MQEIAFKELIDKLEQEHKNGAAEYVIFFHERQPDGSLCLDFIQPKKSGRPNMWRFVTEPPAKAKEQPGVPEL